MPSPPRCSRRPAPALLAIALGACAGLHPPARPGPQPEETCADAELVDVLHHTVALTLHLKPASLAGRAEVRVRTRRPTAVLALDAHGLRVAWVRAGGDALPFVQTREHLCAKLPRVLPQGEALEVQLAWEVPTDREVPRFFADQVWAGYDTAAWMPTVLDSAQRATLRLQVTTESELKVAASGQPAGSASTRAGQTEHTFVLEAPAPPFLYALVAGRFDEAELTIDGVRLRALGPAGADLAGALALTAPVLRLLQERTGVAFPGTEYLQAFVHGAAAQEAAGLALLSEEALHGVTVDPTDDWIFSHELAHQWFGWLVACADFGDFWLNEGFATFLVGVSKEARWGPAAFRAELDGWRARSAKVHAEGRDAPVSLSAPPGAPPRPPPRDSELQARGVTYFRGALVLHRLRGELGEVAFWNGVRQYVRARAGRGARTEHLRAAMEAASGRELTGFFSRWVYAPAPELADAP